MKDNEQELKRVQERDFEDDLQRLKNGLKEEKHKPKKLEHTKRFYHTVIGVCIIVILIETATILALTLL